MGRATIISESGAGSYTIKPLHDNSYITTEIADLTAAIITYDEEITTITSEQNVIISEYDNISGELDNAIDAFNAAETPETLELVTNLTTELGSTVARLDKKTRQLGWAKLKKSSATKRKTKLENIVSSIANRQAWNVAYVEGLTGEVNTVEINGEESNILIGSFGSPSKMIDILGQTVSGSLYNFSLYPYWQKWDPTFRFGTITLISGDTATVTLDAATSHYQGLNVNQSGILYDVPFSYLTCNESAFVNGDNVVIGFTGQDWDTPVIIGFQDNPVTCPTGSGSVYFTNTYSFKYCYLCSTNCQYPYAPYATCWDMPITEGLAFMLLPPNHESYCPDLFNSDYGPGYNYTTNLSCPTSPSIGLTTTGYETAPQYEITDYLTGELTFTITNRFTDDFIFVADIYKDGSDCIIDFSISAPYAPLVVPDIYNSDSVNYYVGQSLAPIGGVVFTGAGYGPGTLYTLGTTVKGTLSDSYGNGVIGGALKIGFWNDSIIAAKSDSDPDLATYYSRYFYQLNFRLDIYEILGI